MLSDHHMHTAFSGDSEADPLDMIAAAKEKGLCGLTFTDHLDWDYKKEPGLFDLDIKGYTDTLCSLATKHSTGDFTIRVGIELGLQPHLAERHAALLKEHAFDFIIGSVHQVDGVDPYYDEFFDGKEIVDAYRAYFQCVLANIKAFCDFDSLGHLDYITRYGLRVAKERGENGIMHYADHAAVIDEILTLLIKKEIALEINTGAYRYGMTAPNPSAAIIDRYRALGGRLITLGADAHSPDHVGLAFDQIQPLLTRIGFREYAVYEKRSPHMYPL